MYKDIYLSYYYNNKVIYLINFDIFVKILLELYVI